jgi:hypothetical protein
MDWSGKSEIRRYFKANCDQIRGLFRYRRISYDDEGVYLLDLYREPHMQYYCFEKNFSEACPHGELGDAHRSTFLFKIPREAFEEVKKNGFALKSYLPE